MANAIRIKKNSVPRQPGELARLKVVNGPDYGSTFVILANSITIGRGEDNDIVISDLKSSRSHAGLAFTAKGWQLRDFGSANGLSVNGVGKTDVLLKNNDTITLGETTFEFLASTEVGTQVLSSPPKTPRQIQSDQAAFQAHQKQIRGVNTGGIPAFFSIGNQPKTAAPKKTITQKPAVVIALVALIVVIFITGEDDSRKRSVRSAKQKVADNLFRNIASALPPDLEGSKSINKAAETFFKSGFREYRERNYLRARTQFETALQIMPNHLLARLYLDNSNKAIEDEVKTNLAAGKRTMEAGKLKEARNHFAQILRLFYRNQTDPAFIEAKDQIHKIEKEMKGGSP